MVDHTTGVTLTGNSESFVRAQQVAVEASKLTEKQVLATSAAVRRAAVQVQTAVTEEGRARAEQKLQIAQVNAALDSQVAAERVAAAEAVKSAAAQRDAAAAVARAWGVSGQATSGVLAVAGAKADGLAEKLNRAGLLSTVALAGIAAESIKMAGDFQSSVQHLQTDAGESAQNLGLVGKGLLTMSGQVGFSANTLAQGMYTVESAGFHGAAALTVMKAAAEGAKVGNADLGTVTDAVTSALNAYGLGASQANAVTSQMIATTAAGKMRLGDLAAALSAVLPNAAAAKISYAEVGGALATMTSEGVTAQQAAQNLNHAIVNLINPNAVAVKEMEQLGLSVTDLETHLGDRGLTGTYKILADAIVKNMASSGLVSMTTMKQNADAAAALKKEIAAMPPYLAQLSQSFLDGKTSAIDYLKTARSMDAEGYNLGKQFVATTSHALGFNDLMRTGQPAVQTYQAALAKLTGGQVSLNVALELTGAHMGTFLSNVTSISAAAKESGTDVRDWAVVQGTFNQQLSEAKYQAESVAVSLGTKMMPAVQTVTHWLAEGDHASMLLYGGLGLLTAASVRYAGVLTMQLASAATTAARAAGVRLGMITVEETETQALTRVVQESAAQQIAALDRVAAAAAGNAAAVTSSLAEESAAFAAAGTAAKAGAAEAVVSAGAVEGAAGGAAVAEGGVGLAAAGLAGPIGIGVAALGVLGAGLYTVIHHSDDTAKELKTLQGVVDQTFQPKSATSLQDLSVQLAVAKGRLADATTAAKDHAAATSREADALRDAQRAAGNMRGSAQLASDDQKATAAQNQLIATQQAARQELDKLEATYNKVTGAVGTVAKALGVDQVTAFSEATAAGLDFSQDSTTTIISVLKAIGGAEGNTQGQIQDATDALNTQKTALTSGLSALQQHQDALGQESTAISSLTQSIKTNGAGLDANRQALSGVSSAMQGLIGSANSPAQAANEVHQFTDALTAQMRAAGLSSGQVNTLLQSYGLLPGQIKDQLDAQWPQLAAQQKDAGTTVGKAAADGMAAGIKNNLAGIQQAAQQAANTVDQTLVGHLLVHSPSRLTYGIGQFAAQGLALGIQDGTGQVAAASMQLARAASGTIGQVIDPATGLTTVDPYGISGSTGKKKSTGPSAALQDVKALQDAEKQLTVQITEAAKGTLGQESAALKAAQGLLAQATAAEKATRGTKDHAAAVSLLVAAERDRDKAVAAKFTTSLSGLTAQTTGVNNRITDTPDAGSTVASAQAAKDYADQTVKDAKALLDKANAFARATTGAKNHAAAMKEAAAAAQSYASAQKKAADEAAALVAAQQQAAQDAVDLASAQATYATVGASAATQAYQAWQNAQGQLAIDVPGTTKYYQDATAAVQAFQAAQQAQLQQAQDAVDLQNAQIESGVRLGDTIGAAAAKIQELTNQVAIDAPNTLKYLQDVTALQQAQADSVSAAVALQNAQIEASLNLADPNAVAQAKVTEAQNVLGADTPGTLQYYQDLASLHQAQLDLTNATDQAAQALGGLAQQTFTVPSYLATELARSNSSGYFSAVAQPLPASPSTSPVQVTVQVDARGSVTTDGTDALAKKLAAAVQTEINQSLRRNGKTLIGA